MTKLGKGTVVGREYIFKVPRFFVDLGPVHIWTFKEGSAAFWKEELTILDDDNDQQNTVLV